MYQITMPSQITSGIDIYNFGSWSDADVNPVKIINLISNITLTATYLMQTRTHMLSIDTSPITVTFTIQRLS